MQQQTSTKLQPSGLRTLRTYQLAKKLAHLVYSVTAFLNSTDGSRLLELYNHTWNTIGALIASLQDKKLDGSWNRTLKEEQESYDV